MAPKLKLHLISICLIRVDDNYDAAPRNVFTMQDPKSETIETLRSKVWERAAKTATLSFAEEDMTILI